MTESPDYRAKIRQQYELSDPPQDETSPEESTTMAELGYPDAEFKTVHVTGTNGAGSTSHFISEVLTRSGYTVGQFSDIKVIEQGGRDFFRIDGRPISGEDMLELADEVTQRVETTEEWEMLVAMACVYFARHDVDIAVFEVGVGGKNDATNMIENDVSVIPSVGLDHADRLGDSIESVARHKAGIFGEGSVAVVNGPDEAQRVAREIADTVGADFYTPATPVRFECEDNDSGYTAEYAGERVSTRFIAEFYCTNINTAMTALGNSSFEIEAEAVREVVSAFQMPGRSELLSDLTPAVLFDGAHNSHAASELARAVARLPMNAERTLVFNVLYSDDWEQMLGELDPHVDRIIATARQDIPEHDRVEQILTDEISTPATLEPDPRSAFGLACDQTDGAGVVIVTGSFQLCKKLRPNVVESETERPWMACGLGE